MRQMGRIVMILKETTGALLAAVVGGLLVGLSAFLMLFLRGRIAGISGVFSAALRRGAETWHWSFVAGLVLAGLAARLAGLVPSPALAQMPIWLLGVAGLLVGFGTRMGRGCTSGHGVCGLANLSGRSLIAVAIFMIVAASTHTLLTDMIFARS